MFHLTKILSTLVLPPAGPILLALFGVWLSRKHPRFGRSLTTLALLSLFALALPPVANSLLQTLEVHPPITQQGMKQVQAIVILGGGTYYDAPEYAGDTVSRYTLERLRYGALLQKRSSLPILVTGGAPFGGRPEGELMREAIERDFGGRVQWVEGKSRDTAENAVYSAELLKKAGIQRIALLSHGWHLPRAISLFERQGLEVIAAPTAFTTQSPSQLEYLLPSTTALSNSTFALREWLGRFVQQLKNQDWTFARQT